LLLRAVSLAVGHHLFKLLLLRIGEQSFDAIAAVLHYRLNLGVAIFGRKRVVGAQRLDLLLTIGDDGPNLVGLLLVQTELSREHADLALRACGTMLGASRRGGVGGRILIGDADLRRLVSVGGLRSRGR
jgi:hypothetical protein